MDREELGHAALRTLVQTHAPRVLSATPQLMKASFRLLLRRHAALCVCSLAERRDSRPSRARFRLPTSPLWPYLAITGLLVVVQLGRSLLWNNRCAARCPLRTPSSRDVIGRVHVAPRLPARSASSYPPSPAPRGDLAAAAGSARRGRGVVDVARLAVVFGALFSMRGPSAPDF